MRTLLATLILFIASCHTRTEEVMRFGDVNDKFEDVEEIPVSMQPAPTFEKTVGEQLSKK